MADRLQAVLDYHQRTKHHFHRYAAGPGGLDWATQPEAFRHFDGSPRYVLPLVGDTLETLYANLYSVNSTRPQPLTISTVGALLELSMGLSASKQYGDTRWALRCNPSSGNLHPTEAYVVLQNIAGVADGVHHYVSRDHLLEQRCAFVAGQPVLPPDSFVIGLTSIHWREAWKYGERAFRYCQHDTGHAIAAIRYAAAALGWRAQALTHWSDSEIAHLLGLNRDNDFGNAEREYPEVILFVHRGLSAEESTAFRAASLNDLLQTSSWSGVANKLSPHHAHDWPIIESVAKACEKPATQPEAWRAPVYPAPRACHSRVPAADLIRQRRSAQSFDGIGGISADALFRMLDTTLPRIDTTPWDAIDWVPRVHLALFVHRVEGLSPGLYLFLRNDHIEARMRAELSAEFNWVRAEASPDHFHLYRVVTADARQAAKALSCHQDIAADGAFSLGMLCEFDESLNRSPWAYRRLFWETGMVGQVLYLEAEAAGVRGTGIGCFFDDAVHDLSGIKGTWLQSLYHFTVGHARADERLQTLPPYAHLQR